MNESKLLTINFIQRIIDEDNESRKWDNRVHTRFPPETNGNLHIRGSRAEEVAYTLDGAQITDVVNTGRDLSAIPEALAEITVSYTHLRANETKAKLV